MTDLTALTEITAPTTDDLVYVVDAPSGAKNPRKCSIANLVASADINADKITSGTLPLGRLTGTITTAELSASAGIVSGQLATGIDANKIADGSISNSEFKYLNNLSDNAQTQIDGKSPTAGNTSLTTTGAIGTGTWEATDVAVAHGGTGSSNASDARTALGVAIGSDVQIYNANTALTTNTLNDFAVPTASLALGTQKITGLVAGVADSDAATKGQVDAAQAGLDAKSACRVATTADVTTWVYNNGTGTLTASGNGVVTIDSIALLINDRILVKNQSPANENGLYSVTIAGTASATQVLTRTTDADEDDEVTSGLYTFITEGTDNGSTGFVLVTADPITVGTTALSFSQFSGLAQLNAGTGITKTGNTINVDAIQTQVTDVGALDEGSITSGFGAIDNGSSTITTTGALSGGTVTSTGALSGTAITGTSLTTGTGAITSGAITSSGIITGTSTVLLAQGALRLNDSNNSNYAGFKAPADVTTSYDLVLPPATTSTTGNVLKMSSTANTLEWGSAGGLGDELTTKLQASTYPAGEQSPATEGSSAVSIFVKTIDANNQGLYIRIKKNGGYQDVQIA